MKKVLFCAAILCAATLVACGGDKGKLRMGSLSGDFDSLSYSLGANVGFGLNRELKEVPFDYARINKGIEEGALDKASLEHEKAVEIIRGYLMKYGSRAQALVAQRAAADSARWAAGDSTKMEYPADPSLFENDSERDSVSYALGVDIGSNIKKSEIPAQLVWVQEAMNNTHDGDAKMTEDQVNNYLQHYFMVTRPAEAAEASAKWLEKIEKKSGVKKTESGLLYKIEVQGDENVIAKDDRDEVEVHYKGMTRQGVVFDASRLAEKPEEAQKMIKQYYPDYKDEPAKFPLNRVIKGWTEGMKLVGKGGKITLWIPSDMAYGPRGNGRDIGPNEALQFEVEVLDVTPFQEPTPAPVEAVTPVMTK